MCGGFLPARYLPNYTPTEGEDDFSPLLIALVVFVVVAVIFLFIFIVAKMSKSSYQTPKISMETLGIKRGLTAVEASYLLDMKPPQLVTEILYSLLQKRRLGRRK
jgi:hypothetical protein